MNDRAEILKTLEQLPDWATVDQKFVAKARDCSEKTLERERWLKRGIPFAKENGRVRYRVSDVRNALGVPEAKVRPVEAVPA